MLCHWRRLSLPFYETFAMIVFLSLKCFLSLFLYGIIYWIFKNTPLEIVDGGGGYNGISTYAMGGGARSLRTCAYDGQGVKFLSFWCVRTN